MSTENTPKQSSPDRGEHRTTVEDRVERIATYWGRALVDAWRTVFPPREDYR